MKLKYTRKIIKKHNEHTLEGLTEIISTLHRDQGIIPLDLFTKYENKKQSWEWYDYATKIVNSYSEFITKEFNSKTFDPLFKWNFLCCIPLDILQEATEKALQINHIEGYEASRLINLLSRARWKIEAESLSEDKLIEVGLQLEKYMKNCEQFDHLKGNKNIQELVSEYLQTKDRSLFEKMLKTGVYTMVKEFEQLNEFEDSKEFLKHFKINIELKKVIDQIKTYNKVDSKIICIESQNAIEKEQYDAIQIQTDLYSSVVKKVEELGLPSYSYWYEYIRTEMKEFENWQLNLKKYINWKKRLEWKTDNSNDNENQNKYLWPFTLVTNTQEFYTDQKIKKLLLYPIPDLIVSVYSIENSLIEELEMLNDWINRSELVMKEFQDMNYKSLRFTPEVSQNLQILFEEMKQLPLYSESHKDIFKQIYVYNWFSKANDLLNYDKSTPNKDKKEESKTPYEKWLAVNSEIEPFKEDEAIIETKIYKSFKSNFSKAKKLYNLYEYGKGKLHSKVEISEFDKILKDAKSCKISLTAEISAVCKKLISFNTLLSTYTSLCSSKSPIKSFQSLSSSFSHLPFLHPTLTSLKSLLSTYTTLSTSFLSLPPSPSSSLVSPLLLQYQSLPFSFPEADSVLSLFSKDQESLSSLSTQISHLESDPRATWASLQPVLRTLSSVFFRFAEQEDLKRRVDAIKFRWFLETFRQEAGSKEYEVKIGCGELAHMMDEHEKAGGDMEIVKKVKEYLEVVKGKIEMMEDEARLERFEKEGSVIVDYKEMVKERRKKIMMEKRKKEGEGDKKKEKGVNRKRTKKEVEKRKEEIKEEKGNERSKGKKGKKEKLVKEIEKGNGSLNGKEESKSTIWGGARSIGGVFKKKPGALPVGIKKPVLKLNSSLGTGSSLAASLNKLKK